MDVIDDVTEFEWDKGNKDKNWIKHKVRQEEAEQAFFDKNKVISDNLSRSQKEKRYILLGKTKEERLLYIVCTVRKQKIRVISARDINKKEVKLYEKTTKNTKI